MEEHLCGFCAQGTGLGERDGREVERAMSVIPALLPAHAMVGQSFPASVSLSHALDPFSSSADQGRSCFSLCLFSALCREALTLVGALIAPVVETISTGETKSYGGR